MIITGTISYNTQLPQLNIVIPTHDDIKKRTMYNTKDYQNFQDRKQSSMERNTQDCFDLQGDMRMPVFHKQTADKKNYQQCKLMKQFGQLILGDNILHYYIDAITCMHAFSTSLE